MQRGPWYCSPQDTPWRVPKAIAPLEEFEEKSSKIAAVPPYQTARFLSMRYATGQGKVQEKMGGTTLREKDASWGSTSCVSSTYSKRSGSYDLATDNCQHASNEAYKKA